MCLVYYITILSNTAMIAFIEGGGGEKNRILDNNKNGFHFKNT